VEVSDLLFLVHALDLPIHIFHHLFLLSFSKCPAVRFDFGIEAFQAIIAVPENLIETCRGDHIPLALNEMIDPEEGLWQIGEAPPKA
jgi:hypothetical protein